MNKDIQEMISGLESSIHTLELEMHDNDFQIDQRKRHNLFCADRIEELNARINALKELK